MPRSMIRSSVRPLAAFALPIAAVGAALLLSGGCGSGTSTAPAPPLSATTVSPTPVPDGPETTTGSYQNLRFTFTVPKHNYSVGEIVPMTFTLQNTGTTDATFQNVSNAFIEAGIQASDGKNVSAVVGTDITLSGKAATRLTQIYTFVVAAGQTRTYSLQWDQTNRFYPPAIDPVRAAPGTYVLTGFTSPGTLNGTSVMSLPAPPINIVIR